MRTTTRHDRASGPHSGGASGTVEWVTSDSGGRSSGPYYASEPPTSPFSAIGSGPGRRRRRPRVIALIAGVVAVAAAIAVLVIVVLPGGSGNTTGFVPSGNSAAQDAEQITSAFLQAWQSGELNQAARYTDRPSAAESALIT